MIFILFKNGFFENPTKKHRPAPATPYLIIDSITAATKIACFTAKLKHGMR
jgi:hypothetical protein